MHVTYGIESSSGAAVLFSHLSALLPTISIVDTHAAAHGGDFHRMMTDAPPHYDAAGSEPETTSPPPVASTSVEGGSAKKRTEANKTKLARDSVAGSSSGTREGRSHKVQRATAPVYVERDSLCLSPWRTLEGNSPLIRYLCTFSRATELYGRPQLQYGAATSSTSASMQTTRTLPFLQKAVPSMLI